MGRWMGQLVLDGQEVDSIDAALDPLDAAQRRPCRLPSRIGLAGQGVIVYGDGFVLSQVEAESLQESDSTTSEVVHPCLIGNDLNQRPDQSPSRLIIDFEDWPLEHAREYAACFARVEELILPVRATVKRKAYRKRWWQYAERQANLRERTSRIGRVLVRAKTSRTWAFTFIPRRWCIALRSSCSCLGHMPTSASSSLSSTKLGLRDMRVRSIRICRTTPPTA